MSIIILLITVSLLIAFAFLIAYFWAIRAGQFDDANTPAIRILFEEETIEHTSPNQSTNHPK